MSVNVDLIRRVMAQIREHPETWNQNAFRLSTECGTTHCFGGWAIALSDPGWWQDGFRLGSGTRARELLGLDSLQGQTLFFDADWIRDLDQYAALVTEVTGVTFDHPEGAPE